TVLLLEGEYRLLPQEVVDTDRSVEMSRGERLTVGTKGSTTNVGWLGRQDGMWFRGTGLGVEELHDSGIGDDGDEVATRCETDGNRVGGVLQPRRNLAAQFPLRQIVDHDSPRRPGGLGREFT